jgi:drug/metabolite transporter (DMT)-like permease
MNTIQVGYLCALVAALIWSGFILVSRVGGISELTTYDVIAVRYVTCTVLVIPIWWFKFRFQLFDKRLIAASVIGGLIYALFAFRGFSTAPASHAAILLAGLMPFFIIILSYFLNGERPSKQKSIGVGLITFGISLLFWPLLRDGLLNAGHGYFVAAAFCWSLFSVLIKRWNISPWEVTISLAVVTCILYMPYYLAFAPKNISVDLWQDIAIQAVYQGFLATIVQVIFYVKAVQSIGPSSMGAMMAIVPLISGISALFLFNEPSSYALVLGLLMVSFGSWFAHSFIVAKTVMFRVT